MATLNFRRKFQERITAIIYDGTNLAEIQTIAPNVRQIGANVGFTTIHGLTEAAPGFYVVKDNGNVLILDPQEFATLFEAMRDDNKGKLILENLYAQLKTANLTPTEKASLITKLSTVFLALVVGEINGARILANALTTDAVFTAGRKTFLLNQIDAQLL